MGCGPLDARGWLPEAGGRSNDALTHWHTPMAAQVHMLSAHRARPASAPARRVGQHHTQHRNQLDSSGSEHRRPASSGARAGTSRRQRASSARPYRARPSSARTIAGAATPDQYVGWSNDAREALDRRAPASVGRTSYFANDRKGRWRGLGRAQWAWHNQHGHTALAVLQEQRPWDPRPVQRQSIVPDPQHRIRTDIGSVGAAFAESILCGVDFIREEGDNWQNATPTRMMGTKGVSERGWSQTGGVSAAKALRGRSTATVARRTMSELEKFEQRLRGRKPSDELSPFLGLETQPSYVDSSDEEDGSPGASRRTQQQNDGTAAGSRRVTISRPPSLTGTQPESLQRQVRHLHRLHMAAVVIQRVSRGLLVRRRLRA